MVNVGKAGHHTDLTAIRRDGPLPAMLPYPVYLALLVLCWMYALFGGGVPERIGTTIMVVGSALTLVASSGPPYHFASVEIGILIVDAAAFLAFAVLALRADRFWPIWAAAFAALGVLGHLARWYAGTDVTPRAYYVGIVLWSYPILALTAIGTLNHQRRAVLRLAGGRGQGQVEQ